MQLQPYSFRIKILVKTDFKVLEFIEYAWNKKAYPKETHTAIPQIEHIHRLYIIPFFESLTPKG